MHLQALTTGKNMKYLLLVLIFFSPSLWAENPLLSKELITSLSAISEKIDNLETKYPKTFAQSDKFGMSDQAKAVKFIEASKAYPDVKNILSASGFKNLNELYDVSIRFMGALYFVQMQKMPEGSGPNAMIQSLEASIKQMKQSGAPTSVINTMEESLIETKAQLKDMQLATNKASKADKAFVSNNLDWAMSMISEESEEAN